MLVLCRASPVPWRYYTDRHPTIGCGGKLYVLFGSAAFRVVLVCVFLAYGGAIFMAVPALRQSLWSCWKYWHGMAGSVCMDHSHKHTHKHLSVRRCQNWHVNHAQVSSIAFTSGLRLFRSFGSFDGIERLNEKTISTKRASDLISKVLFCDVI